MKMKKRYWVILFLWGIIFVLAVYLKNIPLAEVQVKKNKFYFHSEIVGNDSINMVKDNQLMVETNIEKSPVTSLSSFIKIDEINNIENIQ